jgi:hypothetical protein
MKQLNPAIFCVTLFAAVSCTADSNTSGDQAATAMPDVVRLSSANYAFQAPDTLMPGWTTLRFANHGDDVHYAHIVRLDSGRTVPDLVAAYAEAIRTSGPRPKWVTRFGGPGGVAPGDSTAVTQELEPGSYVWICPVEDEAGNPHFARGEHKTFLVRAADVADRAAAPAANTEIRLQDFSFSFDTTLQAGSHSIRIVNIGREPHDLVLMKLVAGRSIADIQRWLNPERARRPGESADPPPELESLGTLAGGIAAIRPGMQVFIRADLTAGDYVLICMATAPDGRSHVEHGMIRQFKIT